MKKKKSKYTIEIEIEDEENIAVKISSAACGRTEDFGELVPLSFYLTQNLEKAIAELIAQMFTETRIMLECKDKKPDMQMLLKLVEKQSKSLRKRIAETEQFFIPIEYFLGKDRKMPPIRGKALEKEKEKFYQKFAKACDELRKKEEPLSKTKIADFLYSGKQTPSGKIEHTNPLQALKRNLDYFAWSFDEILTDYKQTYDKK